MDQTPAIAEVRTLIEENYVMIFSKSFCPYCKIVKEHFSKRGIRYLCLELDQMGNGSKIQDALYQLTRQKTVPNIFINKTHIGGCDDLNKIASDGTLDSFFGAVSKDTNISDRNIKRFKEETSGINGHNNTEDAFDYDIIVIGGGSGGLAASKEMAKYGQKVAVFDYVVPTPIGTTWGLGGTCVNVGCIPKKLMHQAALLKEAIENHSQVYGYQFGRDIEKGDRCPKCKCIKNKNTTNIDNNDNTTNHFNFDDDDTIELVKKLNAPTAVMEIDWDTMVSKVQLFIKSLNFKAKAALRSSSVTYMNSYARFCGPHTIEATDKKGKITKLTAKYFLISTGLRPTYLNIPGAREYTITSDDLFSLGYRPGKTLCVGASYISLECAGFLKSMGFPVTVMVRSILLRGFDREMSEYIGSFMEHHGVKFLHECIPIKIEKIEDGTPGLYRVYYENVHKHILTEEFNTIILAIGREAKTADLNLESVGVEINPKNKKVLVASDESTSNPCIFSVGDNSDGKPELTPVAIQAGRMLAKRLFYHLKPPEGTNSQTGQNNSVNENEDTKFTELCDYTNIPTTVFTPIEYGCCGLSEDDAKSKYGKDDIIVYKKSFVPNEWFGLHTTKGSNTPDLAMYKIIAFNQKVLGFHYVGPNAGEITQGYGVAIKTGKATLQQFIDSIELATNDSDWIKKSRESQYLESTSL